MIQLCALSVVADVFSLLKLAVKHKARQRLAVLIKEHSNAVIQKLNAQAVWLPVPVASHVYVAVGVHRANDSVPQSGVVSHAAALPASFIDPAIKLGFAVKEFGLAFN